MVNDIIQIVCTMAKKRARDKDESSRDSQKRPKTDSGWVTNIFTVLQWLYMELVEH